MALPGGDGAKLKSTSRDVGTLRPGVELRFGLRIGLDESLQDRILKKVRKRLSRQNLTKLCVNFWENVQHKNASRQNLTN